MSFGFGCGDRRAAGAGEGGSGSCDGRDMPGVIKNAWGTGGAKGMTWEINSD